MSSLRYHAHTGLKSTPPPDEVPAAPSNFKHTIDLPPDSDDFRVNPGYAEYLDEDDEDVEMQHYLEQVFLSSKSQSLDAGYYHRSRHGQEVDVAKDFGLGGLGLIDTSPSDAQSPQRMTMKHTLKGDGAGRDKLRRQDHHLPSTPKSGNAPSSYFTQTQNAREFVEGRSRLAQRDVDANNVELKGFDDFGGPDELDDLNIGLVRPEEQWNSLRDSAYSPHSKGKGKSRDGGW